MRRNLLLATSVIAGLAGAAVSANAQTATGFNVLGGGSSLAANLYNRTAQSIAAMTNVGQNVLTEGMNTVGATAGAAQGELGYTADGSGAGQKAFLLQDATVHGFTAGLPVSFGASDAYLTQPQVDCWNGVSGACATAGYTAPAAAGINKGGPLIQIPAFGTAIVVAHTNATSKSIELDDNDLCGIFSGKITDWSGVETGTAKNRAGQAGPITVAYRQDGSGTSFLFTQHLAKVCNTTNTATGVTFSATKYFADVFGAPTVSGSSHTISTAPSGANFVPASGSSGVANQLISGTGIVGYLTPDFTSIAPNALSHIAKVASLNSTTPAALTAGKSATDVAALALTSPYQFIKYAKLMNSHSGKAYYPNAGGTTKALTNPNTTDYSPGYPTSKTAALDPTKWIPQIADPIDGYPIVGYTTLDLATCYSNTAVNNYVKAFLVQLYLAGNKTNMMSEGFVTVPSGYSKTISSVFVKGTTPYALDIGNPNVCNTRNLTTTHAGL